MEEELQPLASVGILPLEYKDLWNQLSASVEIAEVLVLLDQNLVVEDYLYLFEALGDVVPLLLLERPVLDEAVAVFEQGQFELTDRSFQQCQQHSQHVQLLHVLLLLPIRLLLVQAIKYRLYYRHQVLSQDPGHDHDVE